MNTITCVACGKTDLTRNEIGINKKLLGENIKISIALIALQNTLM